mmetsp:Transcript_9063/g.28675  ORF Transcript_9063/g.28675 Transcript_9063/m.28675 type:complete len:239 (-) Transcript_9063:1075-1791(-)
MVVGWCRMSTSASKKRLATGLADGWASTMPLRTEERFSLCPCGSLMANDALCPAHTSLTGRRLVWMDLIVAGWKAPSGSGPSSRLSPCDTRPAKQVPATTVPTPDTMKESSMWNSAGSERCDAHSALLGSRCRKVRRKSRPSPETLETRKMGTTRPEGSALTAVITSEAVRTTMGILLAPGDLRMELSVLTVRLRMWSGAMSTLVTTTNTGILRASAIPRCSFVIRCTPMLAPSASSA